ncbi:thiol reductant ABC exporter subunit CydD [Pseudovibrio flavus]|uniref:thiol reductant ABC exporter subunit CydD n=1 Tax=Pseudovibrio flavus TaxID=2529854 RepID=UPI0012BB6EA8
MSVIRVDDTPDEPEQRVSSKFAPSADKAKQAGRAKKRRARSQGQIWLDEQTALQAKTIGRSARLQALAELLWIPQAALLALGIGAFVDPQAKFSQFAFSPLFTAICILLIAVLRHVLRKKGTSLSLNAATQTRDTLQRRLINRLASLSPAHQVPASGAVASVLVDHVQALGPYMSRYLPIKNRMVLVPLVILLAVACVSWFVALVLLLCAPLVPAFMAIIGIRAKKASDRQFFVMSNMSAVLLDRLRGLETLRLFGAVERTENQIAELGGEFRKSTMAVLRIAFLSSTALELFAAIGVATTAIYVGFSLLGYWSFGSYGQPISLTTGLFMLLLVPEFFAPLRLFSAAYHDRASAIAAGDHLAEQDAALKGASGEVEGTQAASTLLPLPPKGAVVLEGLCVSRAGRPVLRDVNLTLSRPELVVISGPSGAGKSTLIDALLGFLQPEGGRVLYGDQPFGAYGLSNWQQSLALVSQAPQLFHGSIRANLKLAKQNASDEELIAALDASHARAVLLKKEGGLSAVVGEDGSGLSLGELRRVAMARAFLRKDAPLVIADEPTADLDGKTAAVILEGLVTLSKSAPVLCVTHDKRVMAMADRHLRLQDGMLQEVLS